MDEEMNPTKRKKRDHLVEGNRLFDVAKDCLRSEDIEGAIASLREGIDLYQNSECFSFLISMMVRRSVVVSTEQLKKLEEFAEAGDVSDQFYLAIVKLYCGNQYNKEQGMYWAEQACRQNHAYALYVRGMFMPRPREEPTISMWEKAESLGVADASDRLAYRWFSLRRQDPRSIRVALVHAKRGALLDNRRCEIAVRNILKYNPRESTPWSMWSPSLHWSCADVVKDAIFTWLLIAKRLEVSKDLTLLICSYVCTETRNERYCDRWLV